MKGKSRCLKEIILCRKQRSVECHQVSLFFEEHWVTLKNGLCCGYKHGSLLLSYAGCYFLPAAVAVIKVLLTSLSLTDTDVII